MKLSEFISFWEQEIPLNYQEDFDNAGLIIGNPNMVINGAIISLDVNEDVILDAINRKCNLIISHHPLIFKGLKKITGKNYVENSIILAVKNDIAIYCAHTNLDNVIYGVNSIIKDKLNLQNTKVLRSYNNSLMKLITFVPKLHAIQVRDALFNAGAGQYGNYDSCSYNVNGFGTFKANSNAHPFVGELNKLHIEDEIRIETIFPSYLLKSVEKALLASHPYEVPAYDFIKLENESEVVGSGIIGELPVSENIYDFLNVINDIFSVKCLKHNAFNPLKIRKIAFCGGSGSFLIQDAINANADIYITADLKYHEFFDTKNNIILVDIGHFESEQFTNEIIYQIIQKKMPTFAVQISKVNTNPIKYL